MNNFGTEEMLGILTPKCVAENFVGSVIPFVNHLGKYATMTLFITHKKAENEIGQKTPVGDPH